uniref:Uncharacterized protein n=1 Tax=Candidatus Methanogaster sp. ANME-2c ERB4 TaxID=2759911 RepID=A0A7G9YQW7_9EURY|nr:hypothetical protein CKJHOKLD_00022 [Methanosarcinales archaeon ANME-2c ERB4]
MVVCPPHSSFLLGMEEGFQSACSRCFVNFRGFGDTACRRLQDHERVGGSDLTVAADIRGDEASGSLHLRPHFTADTPRLTAGSVHRRLRPAFRP